MAFTDDGIRAKLSSLNESQDSISTVSQWIIFHRRHADRTAQIWMQRVKESPPNRKLCLIYLANEIVQQSKIRKKEEFLKAYEPIIVEASSAAYKGSSSDVQNKIRRVVEVWRARQVFTPTTVDQIEGALTEIDKSRSGRKPALGGSLFSGSSIPPEVAPINGFATTLQKAEINAKPAITSAKQDYEKITNPNYTIPPAAVHAASLSNLVKKLAAAEGAVAESIRARKSLISGLEALLEASRIKLSNDEAQVADLGAQKQAIDERRSQVENAIARDVSDTEFQAISSAPFPIAAGAQASGRPDIEELTPPPMESFTPVGSPKAAIPDDVFPEPVTNPTEPESIPAPPGATAISTPATAIGAPAPGADLLSSLTRARQDDGTNGFQSHGTLKKRKMSRSSAEDEFAAFAGDGDIDGIDANVGDLI